MNSSMNHTAPPASNIVYRHALRRSLPHGPTTSTAHTAASDATKPAEYAQAGTTGKRPVLHLRRSRAEHGQPHNPQG